MGTDSRVDRRTQGFRAGQVLSSETDLVVSQPWAFFRDHCAVVRMWGLLWEEPPGPLSLQLSHVSLGAGPCKVPTCWLLTENKDL